MRIEANKRTMKNLIKLLTIIFIASNAYAIPNGVVETEGEPSFYAHNNNNLQVGGHLLMGAAVDTSLFAQ